MCECKDASIEDSSETKRVIVVYAYVDTYSFCIIECDVVFVS